jgi:hypothetical protein
MKCGLCMGYLEFAVVHREVLVDHRECPVIIPPSGGHSVWMKSIVAAGDGTSPVAQNGGIVQAMIAAKYFQSYRTYGVPLSDIGNEHRDRP